MKIYFTSMICVWWVYIASIQILLTVGYSFHGFVIIIWKVLDILFTIFPCVQELKILFEKSHIHLHYDVVRYWGYFCQNHICIDSPKLSSLHSHYTALCCSVLRIFLQKQLPRIFIEKSRLRSGCSHIVALWLAHFIESGTTLGVSLSSLRKNQHI